MPAPRGMVTIHSYRETESLQPLSLTPSFKLGERSGTERIGTALAVLSLRPRGLLNCAEALTRRSDEERTRTVKQVNETRKVWVPAVNDLERQWFATFAVSISSQNLGFCCSASSSCIFKPERKKKSFRVCRFRIRWMTSPSSCRSKYTR